MKFKLRFALSVITVLLGHAAHALSLAQTVQEGDLILQRSTSSQSQAIANATHSEYTHVGMIVFRGGSPYVLEAEAGVSYRSLSAWVAAGEEQKYVLRRWTGGLTADQVKTLKAQIPYFLGKPYDKYFDWDDTQIYCSELVWKMYDRALNLNIGTLQKLRDFDMTSFAVEKLLFERYGFNIPWNETVIAPSAIANSTNLTTIIWNWF